MASLTDLEKVPLIFNVFKPISMSSFSVVHHFKKNLHYNFGKIGHFGTLDPFAEGVLLVGVQGAQKLNEYIHQCLPKTYRAKGIFGIKTLSGDSTSEIQERKDLDSDFINLSIGELEGIIKEKFLGEYWQTPHQISATKFEGKRLYLHALEGRLIKKEKVKRFVYDFHLLSYNYPECEFTITVGPGTYVRSFFEDMSQLFGGVGHLGTLHRESIGPLKSSESIQTDQWPKKNSSYDLTVHGITVDRVLILSSIFIEFSMLKKYLQGQRIDISFVRIDQSHEAVSDSSLYWVYSEDGLYLVGLARIVEGKVHSIFNLPSAIAFFS